jgi:hypothetical protein
LAENFAQLADLGYAIIDGAGKRSNPAVRSGDFQLQKLFPAAIAQTRS